MLSRSWSWVHDPGRFVWVGCLVVGQVWELASGTLYLLALHLSSARLLSGQHALARTSPLVLQIPSALSMVLTFYCRDSCACSSGGVFLLVCIAHVRLLFVAYFFHTSAELSSGSSCCSRVFLLLSFTLCSMTRPPVSTVWTSTLCSSAPAPACPSGGGASRPLARYSLCPRMTPRSGSRPSTMASSSTRSKERCRGMSRLFCKLFFRQAHLGRALCAVGRDRPHCQPHCGCGGGRSRSRFLTTTTSSAAVSHRFTLRDIRDDRPRGVQCPLLLGAARALPLARL